MSRFTIVVCAILLSLSLAPSAFAATIYVPANETTIGAAIANASAGDTIYVDSGAYRENIVIPKTLTIIGRDTGSGIPTVDVSGGTGIDIAADNVVVQKLRVTGASTGIRVKDCSNVKVMNCIVLGGAYGVMLNGVNGCTVMASTVTGSSNVGVSLVDSGGNAIYLNDITNNQYGVSLTGESGSNSIYMNTLRDNAGGNGLASGRPNSWNSSIPIVYGYGGKQYSGYLGNYWGDLGGKDSNGDGILDSKVTLAADNGDYDPLAAPLPSAPTSDFKADYTSGAMPLPVQFTDASTGYPVSWRWDFGDGATSSVQNPAHIYKNAGTYAVTLTVENARGTGKLVRSGYVTVSTEATVTATATPLPTATLEPWPTLTVNPNATATKAPTTVPTATAKPTPGPGMLIGMAALCGAAFLGSRRP